MNLDEQLKILISEASQSGIPADVMKQAIVPVLKKLAGKLRFEQYYILQSPDGDWVITTLAHRQNPKLEKKAIYAFASDTDAVAFPSVLESKARPRSIPTTHLLFQLFPMEGVNSIIFMEQPGNLEKGKEMWREEITEAIAQKIKKLRAKPKKIPPNFA